MAYSKTGFSYYNVDTDRYQDIRIKKLKHKFGGEGLAVYDYILCEIYRDKGCYLEWNEFTQFDIADSFKLKEEEVFNLLNFLLEVGLFDKEVFQATQKVTSRSIQLRYIDMSIRAKRKDKSIPDDIQLLEVEEKTPIVPEKVVIIPEELTELPEDSSKIPAKKKRQSNDDFDLSFVSEDFKPIVEDWLSYKRSRKETYKSIKSVEIFHRKLVELSHGLPVIAQAIVDQSIGNNWAGIFELKQNGQNWKNNTSERHKEQLFREATEISRRNS